MTTLTWDEVVRFRSARHLLTHKLSDGEEAGPPVLQAISTRGGIQAQVASAAELSLWARMDGLKTGEIDEMLSQKLLVKTWAMRGTLHLLTADDLPVYVAAMRASRIGYRKLAWLKSFDTDLEE